MSESNAAKLPPIQPSKVVNMTVREAIQKLVMCEDMDAELCFTFHNSDPIPVVDITDTGEGQVVVSS